MGFSPGAVAGEVSDRAADAETRLQNGDAGGALESFDRATEALWEVLPLQLRVATFAQSVAGYGDFQPRTVPAFRPGEAATVYLQPVGYGFERSGGRYVAALDVGMEVRTPGGLILARADDFGRLEWRARVKRREVHGAVSIDLPDLKPGEYELVLTATDATSEKTATVRLPFSVRE